MSWFERLAACITIAVARGLEDCGVELDSVGQARFRDTIADELGRAIMPDAEVRRLVRESFRAGLAPDPE